MTVVEIREEVTFVLNQHFTKKQTTALIPLFLECGMPKLKFGLKRIFNNTYAFYNPFKHTITANTIQLIIEELAHAKQRDTIGLKKFVNRYLSGLVKSKLRYRKTYSIKGSLEYEAHEVIAKTLRKKFLDNLSVN